MLVLRTSDGRGVVVVARRGGAEFTQRDRTLATLYVRRFAEQGAVIADGQHHRSGWTRQLEAIQRIAARLTRLASVEEVGATICSETRQVIDYDEAHVLVANQFDAAFTMVAAARGTGPDAEVAPLPTVGPAADAVARAARGGVPVIALDLPDAGPDRAGVHSMLAVPLHFETRVSGVICLIARGVDRFDDDDLRLLQILSDQAAVAIENARLLQGRDELVHELAGLLEISEAAGAAQDERTIAALLAARVRQQTKTDAAIVARWDEGSTVMSVICRDGTSDDADTIDVADSAARRQVLREGRPMVIQSDEGDLEHETGQLRDMGAYTLILMPLNAGGRTIGLIELVACSAPASPTAAEMHACEAMASIAAAGMERVRVLEQLRSAADIDLVTGVQNHRYLQERLRQEIRPLGAQPLAARGADARPRQVQADQRSPRPRRRRPRAAQHRGDHQGPHPE